MKRLSIILLLCVPIFTFSQSDSTWKTLGDQHFIVLFDGSLIIGN